MAKRKITGKIVSQKKEATQGPSTATDTVAAKENPKGTVKFAPIGGESEPPKKVVLSKPMLAPIGNKKMGIVTEHCIKGGKLLWTKIIQDDTIILAFKPVVKYALGTTVKYNTKQYEGKECALDLIKVGESELSPFFEKVASVENIKKIHITDLVKEEIALLREPKKGLEVLAPPSAFNSKMWLAKDEAYLYYIE